MSTSCNTPGATVFSPSIRGNPPRAVYKQLSRKITRSVTTNPPHMPADMTTPYPTPAEVRLQQLQPKFYKYCVSKHSYMYIYPVWTFIFIPVWLFIFIMSAWIDKCIFSLFREPGPWVPSPVIDLTHTLGPLVPQLWEMGFSYHQISSGRMIKCGKDFPWPPALYGWIHWLYWDHIM